jgi:hypothetical protein
MQVSVAAPVMVVWATWAGRKLSTMFDSHTPHRKKGIPLEAQPAMQRLNVAGSRLCDCDPPQSPFIHSQVLVWYNGQSGL